MPPQIEVQVDAAALTITRKARTADHDFIFKSWLTSMRDAACGEMMPQTGGRVPEETYFPGQRARIAALLADPATRALCHSFTDDMDVSVGWGVARGDCLHYVFVKPAWRRQGISRLLIRALLPDGVRRFAVRTSAGNSFVVPGLAGAVYDPYAIDPRRT